MAGAGSDGAGDLAAGAFAAWADAMRGALQGERGTDVPCGTCTACCTSSQFVHIGPDETDTLDHVPPELLFPAPGLPPGHVLLGYDEHGRCPMLGEAGCSIYAHRPITCRTYDCRVFPATGVVIGGRDKAAIARQAARWRFDFATPDELMAHEAMRAAAVWLDEHRQVLPAADRPTTATQLAVLAVAVHEAFVGTDATTGRPCLVDPEPAVVRDVVQRRRTG